MQLQRNEVLTGLLVVGTVAVITATLVLLGAPGFFRPLATYRIYIDNAAEAIFACFSRRRAARPRSGCGFPPARTKRYARAIGGYAKIRSPDRCASGQERKGLSGCQSAPDATGITR